MNYGEIVQFECHIRMGNPHSLHMFFGDASVHPEVSMNIRTILDLQREISVDVKLCTNCSANETVVGRVWILVNRKTIPVIKFFWCRVHHNHTFEDSDTAYIEVQYPECTVIPLQPNVILVSNTSSFTQSQEVLGKSTSISLNVNDPELCSIGELSSQGI